MNIPHEKFCVLPWISLETSPIGTVRPCCLAENELRDNAGEKFNLGTAEFGTIQNCQDMRNLRQLTAPYLDSVLYLLGITREEIEEAGATRK